jgi:glycosyltransferase involved in cell wall biosynthesis
MDASIVIPTYNRRELLSHALVCLARQTYPAEQFEVVVADDGSADGTEEFLAAASFPFTLRSVCHKNNRGRAAARNSALAVTRGDLIIFLDDDMEVAPGFVAAHLAAHRREAAAVAVVGNAVTHPALPVTTLNRYLDHTGVHRLSNLAPVPFRYFNSNNASVAMHVLKSIGFFNELFREYGGEDTEMGYRLCRYGATFRYAPDALSYHLGIKTIDELCRQLHTYGATGLYAMYRQDPAYRQALRLTVIESLDYTRDTKKTLALKLVYRLLYRKTIFKIMSLLARHLEAGPCMFPIFDYLFSYSYLAGIRTRIIEEQRRERAAHPLATSKL